MHKSYEKNSKSLKLTKGKSLQKGAPKKIKDLEEDEDLKLNPLDKPKKKAPKKFFFDDDEEIDYKIKK